MALNIGFIGVGGIAQRHLAFVQKAAGARVAAVCDILEERAKAAAEKFGGVPFTDWKKMVNSARPDAVYVCVIPGAHGTIELELARMGIPFFVEKPVHLSLAATGKVIQEVKKRKLVTAVGYHWRAMKQVRRARAFLSGRKVSLVQGWWYGGMPGVWWWRRKKESGGQHVEQTTHIFDLARYLCGDVESVSGAAGFGAMKDVENYDVEDVSAAVLRFKTGAVGTIVSGCIAGGTGRSLVGIRLDGRGWTVDFTGFRRLLIAKPGKPVEFEADCVSAFPDEDHAFLRAVKSADPAKVFCTYEDGVKTLAVTLAADKAFRTGRTQKVES